MKKLLNVFFVVFFILCLGIIIGTIYVIVNCCSGNKETIYVGEIEKSKILIERDLGNATMASYMTVYIDGQKVYDEKCFLRDSIENVIWHKEKGILQIFLKEETECKTYRDTITITIKDSQHRIRGRGY